MTQIRVSPKRILVVDDEESVRWSLEMLLELDRHVVRTAGDAEEALALFREETFGLVLTDYLMPGMKGTELAALIKGERRKCPVIMVTAYAEMLPRQLLGVDCLVPKPFTRRQLRKAIANAFGIAQTGRETEFTAA